MKTFVLFVCALMMAVVLGGCADSIKSGPVVEHQMNIIGGGVGQDIPDRVYQEYGQDTDCVMHTGAQGSNGQAVYPCPDDNGIPHDGGVCSNLKWSVQFTNDHPTDTSEEKYGLPYDPQLIYSLQEWRANQTTLRYYFIRYSDTQCKFTDNEVVYCVELTTYSLVDSANGGCIKAMHRAFPGVNIDWKQGLDYAGPKGPTAGVVDPNAVG